MSIAALVTVARYRKNQLPLAEEWNKKLSMHTGNAISL
jgi:hypothetical protein